MRNILLAISITLLAAPAAAGVYQDDLTRCIVKNTSPNDKLKFIKWMALALSGHPEIGGIENYPAPQREKLSSDLAGIFERFLLEQCLNEAQLAAKFEGQAALVAAFRYFGQVASQEIFGHPKVSEEMGRFEKYIDGERLNKTLGLE